MSESNHASDKSFQKGFEKLMEASSYPYHGNGLTCTLLVSHPFKRKKAAPECAECRATPELYFIADPGDTERSVMGLTRFIALMMQGHGMGYNSPQRPLILRRIFAEQDACSEQHKVYFEIAFCRVHFMAGGCTDYSTRGKIGKQSLDAVFSFLSAQYQLDVQDVTIPFTKAPEAELDLDNYIRDWQEKYELSFIVTGGENSFRTGDQVVLTERARTHLFLSEKASWCEEGEVFEVTSVATYPANCSCGHGAVPIMMHHDACNIPKIHFGGHHQRATIKTRDGYKQCTGAWLEPCTINA